jgi:acyl-[acyl carrier protein]--UDP-N-acetylglucosamine O-acyltransferase
MAKNGTLQNLSQEGALLMILALACMLLVLLFILPFVPGTRELFMKRDASPLFINIDYSRDHRYFAFSFRKLFLDSLEGLAEATEGFRDLMLSKREKVQIIGNARFASGAAVEHILYVIHDLDSENNVMFNKEVYVRGTARIGEDNQLQALACDGDIHIQKGAKFFRWLDAEGGIKAGEQCALGVDATCGGVLFAARACSFMRLYGFPVTTDTHSDIAQEEDQPDSVSAAVFESESIERNLSNIPAQSRKNCSIISRDSLTIGDHSVIRGHVKTHKNLVIGANVTIAGNIFAEGDIEVGPQSRVLGTVFSQKRVLLKQGVRVGARDRIKSVIGKKSITLEGGVRVYGYVMTEGKGLVV